MIYPSIFFNTFIFIFIFFSFNLKKCASCFKEEEQITVEQVEDWRELHSGCGQQTSELLALIDKYSKAADEIGDQTFKLFMSAIKDWTAYEMTFIAIRSGNWNMRNTGIHI